MTFMNPIFIELTRDRTPITVNISNIIAVTTNVMRKTELLFFGGTMVVDEPYEEVNEAIDKAIELSEMD